MRRLIYHVGFLNFVLMVYKELRIDCEFCWN